MGVRDSKPPPERQTPRRPTRPPRQTGQKEERKMNSQTAARRLFSALALDIDNADDRAAVLGFDWDDDSRPRGIGWATIDAALLWLAEQDAAEQEDAWTPTASERQAAAEMAVLSGAPIPAWAEQEAPAAPAPAKQGDSWGKPANVTTPLWVSETDVDTKTPAPHAMFSGHRWTTRPTDTARKSNARWPISW